MDSNNLRWRKHEAYDSDHPEYEWKPSLNGAEQYPSEEGEEEDIDAEYVEEDQLDYSEDDGEEQPPLDEGEEFSEGGEEGDIDAEHAELEQEEYSEDDEEEHDPMPRGSRNSQRSTVALASLAPEWSSYKERQLKYFQFTVVILAVALAVLLVFGVVANRLPWFGGVQPMGVDDRQHLAACRGELDAEKDALEDARARLLAVRGEHQRHTLEKDNWHQEMGKCQAELDRCTSNELAPGDDTKNTGDTCSADVLRRQCVHHFRKRLEQDAVVRATNSRSLKLVQCYHLYQRVQRHLEEKLEDCETTVQAECRHVRRTARASYSERMWHFVSGEAKDRRLISRLGHLTDTHEQELRACDEVVEQALLA